MNSPEGFRGYQSFDRSGIAPEPKNIDSTSSVARREVGGVERTGLSDKVKKIAKRIGTLGLATVMLSGPMVSEVRAEEASASSETEVTDVVTAEPTAEVKASVTAAVEDPEAKVSVKDAKAIVESYQYGLFAPFQRELTDNGCDGAEEGWKARVECGAKWLFAYDNSSGMSETDTKDKFQNYMGDNGRQSIVDYVRTGEVGNLDIIFNDEGDPRMLMVNASDQVIQSVKDAFSLYKENGSTNIDDVIYGLGGVIYFCSGNYGRGPGSFITYKYGVICSEMTDESIAKKGCSSEVLMLLNARALYGEALGVYLYFLRDALDISDLGSNPGDIEISKAEAAFDVYSCLYKKTNLDIFNQFAGYMKNASNGFGSDYNVDLNDPRIKKQRALVLILSEALNGVNLEDIDEIVNIREEYMTV